jgi:hypothetical protein
MSEPSDRDRLLAAVLDDVKRTERPDITHLDGVAAEFGGVDGLLLAVQHRWWTAVDAHLDALLEDPPEDPARAVGDLWRSLARHHSAARMLLDAHADRPALFAAEHEHRRGLMRAVGVDLTALPGPARRVAAPRAGSDGAPPDRSSSRGATLWTRARKCRWAVSPSSA